MKDRVLCPRARIQNDLHTEIDHQRTRQGVMCHAPSGAKCILKFYLRGRSGQRWEPTRISLPKAHLKLVALSSWMQASESMTIAVTSPMAQ